jgi:RNA polymerase sigma-70 factor (ECF subfamily)
VAATYAQEHVLIRQAKAGEADAVAELYRVHSPTVFRYVYFRVQNRATAEDLTGDVFLKALDGLSRYADRGLPFAAWLLRIAHDRVVDYYRRASVRQTESLPEALPDGSKTTEDAAMRRVERQYLYDAMQSLTDEQKMVVQLRFIEGFRLEETAQIMNKSTGAIKAMQHRALGQLAARLGQKP